MYCFDPTTLLKILVWSKDLILVKSISVSGISICVFPGLWYCWPVSPPQSCHLWFCSFLFLLFFFFFFLFWSFLASFHPPIGYVMPRYYSGPCIVLVSESFSHLLDSSLIPIPRGAPHLRFCLEQLHVPHSLPWWASSLSGCHLSLEKAKPQILITGLAAHLPAVLCLQIEIKTVPGISTFRICWLTLGSYLLPQFQSG